MDAPAADDLTAALARATARWPGVAASPASVLAAIAAVAPSAADVATRGDELVLAHAAALGDRVALAAFEREIVPRGRATIDRYTRDPDRTAEVAQQLRIHLLVGEHGPPRLARFDGRAPLSAWVCMCAARLALHALRARRTEADVTVVWSEAVGELVAADPVVETLRQRWAAEVGVALREACVALPPRLRAVVRLAFVESASADEIAAIYQVHRVTVWRWLQEAQERLRDGVREGLRAVVSGDTLATDAMIAWVDDQVMLSLDQALTPTATDVRS